MQNPPFFQPAFYEHLTGYHKRNRPVKSRPGQNGKRIRQGRKTIKRYSLLKRGNYTDWAIRLQELFCRETGVFLGRSAFPPGSGGGRVHRPGHEGASAGANKNNEKHGDYGTFHLPETSFEYLWNWFWDQCRLVLVWLCVFWEGTRNSVYENRVTPEDRDSKDSLMVACLFIDKEYVLH
jgi:hypothetical protein